MPLCRSVEIRQGYLYKRRDNLRGRFAYRPRYAALRFPRPHASKTVDGARTLSAAPSAYVYTIPGGGPGSGVPPPTLALFKSRGHGESEKLISLEVRQARAGDLCFPPRVKPSGGQKGEGRGGGAHRRWDLGLWMGRIV